MEFYKFDMQHKLVCNGYNVLFIFQNIKVAKGWRFEQYNNFKDEKCMFYNVGC